MLSGGFSQEQVTIPYHAKDAPSRTAPGPWHDRPLVRTVDATRHCQVGDLVIIMAYGLCSLEEAPMIEPKVVVVDEHNRPLLLEGESAHTLFSH